MLEYAFFRNALLCVCVISVVSGLVGTYIVVRRQVAVAGGITHACFGGLGIGAWSGVSPVACAAIVAVAAAVGVERMSRHENVRSDSAVAVMWALGMAVGVFFVFLTPGYVPELTAFLFGNILTISTADLWVSAAYMLMLCIYCTVRYRYVVAVAFDADFARVLSLPVNRISMTMTVLTAIGIVLTIKMVGVMLLMSMMSLPQLTAERVTRRIAPMALWSVAITFVASMSGLWISSVVDVPCSALIVLLFGVIYMLRRCYELVTKSEKSDLTHINTDKS